MIRRSARLVGTVSSSLPQIHASLPPSLPSEPAPDSEPAAKRQRKNSSKATQPDGEAKSQKGKVKTIVNGPTRRSESELRARGFSIVAGVDEAGRGPLAGPVVAAACVVPPDVDVPGINDSKKMTEEEREAAYEILTTDPRIQYGVGVVDAETIDQINILQAAMRAMEIAVGALPSRPSFVLVDGNRVPAGLDPETSRAIVKGDASTFCIAAASVIAKVHRDRIMADLDKEFPEYGFGVHKGYPTPAHMATVKRLGPCKWHRRTFQPIKGMLAAEAAAAEGGEGQGELQGGEPAETAKKAGRKKK